MADQEKPPKKNTWLNEAQTRQFREDKGTLQTALNDPDIFDNTLVSRSVRLAALLAESDDPAAREFLAEAFDEHRDAIIQQPTEA